MGDLAEFAIDFDCKRENVFWNTTCEGGESEIDGGENGCVHEQQQPVVLREETRDLCGSGCGYGKQEEGEDVHELTPWRIVDELAVRPAVDDDHEVAVCCDGACHDDDAETVGEVDKKQ